MESSDTGDAKLKLTIKLMTNNLTVEVNKTDTIFQVKQKIKEQIQAEEADQKLIYKGKNLIEFVRKNSQGRR
jgi:hypothetical protein